MTFPDEKRYPGEVPPPFFEWEERPGPVPPPPPPPPQAPGPADLRQPRPASGEQSNGFGIAGFVLALITLVSWPLPVAGFSTWILALVFSCIGLSRRPRNLALAGFVISIFIALAFVALFLAGVALIAVLAGSDV